MSLDRRIGRLEALAGVEPGAEREADREARARIAGEVLKRVSDEDLAAMAEVIERRPDYEPEAAMALREEHPDVWDRYEAIWRQVAEEMARGR